MTNAGERSIAAVAGAPMAAADAPAAAETREEAAHGEPPAEPDLRDPALFLNRELSLLKFQARVLDEARDPRNPLLERLKFLGIVGSNLGEFFMVRIAGLKQQVRAGVTERSGDGRTPAETLAEAREGGFELMRQAREVYADLARELADAGIHILNYDELSDDERRAADEYYTSVVFPVLTPLAFDPGRPFPHISNLSLNLAILLRNPEGEEMFARVKIPKTLPRLVPVCPDGAGRACDTRTLGSRLLWMEQLVAAHLDTLFPGMKIVTAHPFRVTRDAEMQIQELEADDLLETIEEGVRKRRFGSVVRVSVDTSMPERLKGILVENLRVDPGDLITLKPPLGMSGFWDIHAQIDRPDLKDPAFVPALPAVFGEEERDIFSLIRERDILVHHPYDSFSPIVQFFEQAARDPAVLAIKTTLYRVGRRAPVVKALLDAAARGKEVAVLVELKARFDEEGNIEWAKALEAEGVHVVYGLLGLKTHSKIALVVRREGEGIRRYLHLATGNYNAVTAQQYTDLGMFTCDPDMGADGTQIFNYLTGYGTSGQYRKFLVAPVNLRQDLEALVRREIEHQKAGRRGHLLFKMNALVDRPMTRLLYEASRAGVQVDLLVRGICCLRPGVPGVSDNIRVVSIVGRFLEHSRVYYFGNGGDPTILLGSADLMPRNLNRRVEILFPVRDPGIKARLRDEILATYLADTMKARLMRPDGSYERVTPAAAEESLESQAALLALAAGGSEASAVL
ncbi:MAG TPA: polyphosphate kinase 1 [Thermoleophilia bacterium]|nr:polyphosphate kinase 1 [Thermoleophilia bacterium]